MPAIAEVKLLILPIALVAWWSAYRRRTLWWHFLGIQLVATCFTELLALWLQYGDRPNLWLYNTYMPVEYTSLSLMMLHLPVRDRPPWIFTTVLWFLFMAAYVAEMGSKANGDSYGFFNLALVISGSFMAMQAFSSLYRTVELGPLDTSGSAGLWVLASICMYFISSTPVFGLIGHFSETDVELALALLDLNDVLFILRYGLLTLGMLVLSRHITFKRWSARTS